MKMTILTQMCQQLNTKLLKNVKYLYVIYILHISRKILIGNNVFYLYICTSWTAFIINVFLYKSP